MNLLVLIWLNRREMIVLWMLLEEGGKRGRKSEGEKVREKREKREREIEKDILTN